MRLKIGLKLTLGYLAVGMVFASFATYALGTLRDLQAELRTIETDVYPALDLANELVRILRDTEGSFQEAVEDLDPEPLEWTDEMAEAFSAKIATLRQFSRDPDIAKAETMFRGYVQLGRKVVEQFLRTGNLDVVREQLVTVSGLARSLNERLAGYRDARYLEFQAALAAVKASGQRMSRTIILATGAAMGLGVLLALLITRSTAGPIRLMASAAKRIGQGELSTRVPVTATDELGDLAKTFNAMAEDLEQTTVSRDDFDRIIKNMMNALIVLDRDARIKTVNPATVKLLGYAEHELIGKPVTVILAGEEVSAQGAGEIDEIIQGGSISNVEWTYVAKGGKKIPVLFSSSVIRDPDGSTQGVVCVAEDISQRKRAEDELKALNATLEQRIAEGSAAVEERAQELTRSNAELQQFAYVCSHDLKEPLRTIASYAKLLGERYEGKLDPRADDYIRYLVGGATRLHQLLNNLLEYSRVETRGKMFRSVNCEELLKEALDGLRKDVEETDTVVTHDPLPVVAADGDQLLRVFEELLANAIKFRGAEAPCVHIWAKQEDEKWVLGFRDNGMGFETRFEQLAFVIFQQLHPRGKYPGTGFGLALCKKIIQRHGGKIWADSKRGKGSTFLFTLPMRQAPNAGAGMQAS